MAKPATLQIKLISTADTGYFYVTKKNPRTKPEKLELKKYDPRARKHVIFRESKIKQIFPWTQETAMSIGIHIEPDFINTAKLSIDGHFIFYKQIFLHLINFAPVDPIP